MLATMSKTERRLGYEFPQCERCGKRHHTVEELSLTDRRGWPLVSVTLCRACTPAVTYQMLRAVFGKLAGEGTGDA